MFCIGNKLLFQCYSLLNTTELRWNKTWLLPTIISWKSCDCYFKWHYC